MSVIYRSPLSLPPPGLGGSQPAAAVMAYRHHHLRGGVESVLDYEYSPGNLIGHGAFALVFKGRRRKVKVCSSRCKLVKVCFGAPDKV